MACHTNFRRGSFTHDTTVSFSSNIVLQVHIASNVDFPDNYILPKIIYFGSLSVPATTFELIIYFQIHL